MDWDDEFDNGYDGISHDSNGDSSIMDEGFGRGLDPMDITNPVSAYLFLSDDAQDEITGGGKTRMKCLSCEHIFIGEIYERFPECFSPDTEEVTDENDSGYW
jgi:hypothetical protein